MKIRLWFAGLILLVWIVPNLVQAQEIPASRRIETTVLRYLTAPANQPMVMPTDVAIDSKDRVLVLDGVNNRVVRFGANGDFDRIIIPPEEFGLSQPLGLAVDSKDQLWLADTGHHRIVVLSSEAKLIESFELPADGQEHPAKPTDIALTPDNRRAYIVDNINHRLMIRDNETGAWKSMGKKGVALGQFDYPFMICTGIENYVYITEAMGARVQRVSPSDLWSGSIGTWGVELGQLYRPKGIVADASGRIFVGDSTMKVIQVFGPWGRIGGVLTDSPGQPLRLEHPMGMSFDNQGHLYVVEMTKNRVAVLSFASTENSAEIQRPPDPSENESNIK